MASDVRMQVSACAGELIELVEAMQKTATAYESGKYSASVMKSLKRIAKSISTLYETISTVVCDDHGVIGVDVAFRLNGAGIVLLKILQRNDEKLAKDLAAYVSQFKGWR